MQRRIPPGDWLQQATLVLKTLKGPWILAADFNATAEDLKETGWLKLIGGVIFAPEESTCNKRTIDFFVVSHDLAGAVVGTAVIDDALFSPHRPVRLFLRARPMAMMVRTLKAATTICATLPYGPPGKPTADSEADKDMDRHQLYNLFLERWKLKWPC